MAYRFSPLPQPRRFASQAGSIYAGLGKQLGDARLQRAKMGQMAADESRRMTLQEAREKARQEELASLQAYEREQKEMEQALAAEALRAARMKELAAIGGTEAGMPLASSLSSLHGIPLGSGLPGPAGPLPQTAVPDAPPTQLVPPGGPPPEAGPPQSPYRGPLPLPGEPPGPQRPQLRLVPPTPGEPMGGMPPGAGRPLSLPSAPPTQLAPPDMGPPSEPAMGPPGMVPLDLGRMRKIRQEALAGTLGGLAESSAPGMGRDFASAAGVSDDMLESLGGDPEKALAFAQDLVKLGANEDRTAAMLAQAQRKGDTTGKRADKRMATASLDKRTDRVLKRWDKKKQDRNHASAATLYTTLQTAVKMLQAADTQESLNLAATAMIQALAKISDPSGKISDRDFINWEGGRFLSLWDDIQGMFSRKVQGAIPPETRAQLLGFGNAMLKATEDIALAKYENADSFKQEMAADLPEASRFIEHDMTNFEVFPWYEALNPKEESPPAGSPAVAPSSAGVPIGEPDASIDKLLE